MPKLNRAIGGPPYCTFKCGGDHEQQEICQHGWEPRCGSVDSCHLWPPHDLPTHCQAALHHHLQIQCLNLRHISQKVDYVPKANTAIIWIPIFERYVIRCESKHEHQKVVLCLEEIHWTICSKYANHSRLKNQQWWLDWLTHAISEEWPTKHKTISLTHCWKYCPTACHHLLKWLNLIAISLNFVI